MSIPENDRRFFKFSVFNETVTDLVFQLTPISGDADLYGSRSAKRPSIDTADKISNNNYDMQEMIRYTRGVDGDSLVGTYHLTVYAF